MRRTFLFIASVLFVAGCTGSSNSPAARPCTSDTTSCPSGQTCWPIDTVPNLACLPSQPTSGVGARCENKIGVATCSDGLACDEPSPDAGVCTHYCDSQKNIDCPVGYSCRVTRSGATDAGNALTIEVCRLATSPAEPPPGQNMPDLDAAAGPTDAAPNPQ